MRAAAERRFTNETGEVVELSVVVEPDGAVTIEANRVKGQLSPREAQELRDAINEAMAQ
jgi:hypothetical protein